MAVNPYTDSYFTESEQDMLEDLVVESIAIHGMDLYYLPKRFHHLDKVYLEDSQVYYDTAYQLEFYLKSYEGFGGDGHFMSQFGVEIRDQLTFTVANKRFMEEVGDIEGTVRPKEGDLIWYPFTKQLFTIVWADKYTVHYPLGALQMYDVKCELFEYSSQHFATGIALIDAIEPKYTADILESAITTAAGRPLAFHNGDILVRTDYDFEHVDPLDDGDRLQAEAEEILDFTEADVFSERGVY